VVWGHGMVDIDAVARRAAVLFEICAHADLYEADCAPEAPGERLTDLMSSAEGVIEATLGDPQVPQQPGWALYELAGRVLAWLEADAETEQKR